MQHFALTAPQRQEVQHALVRCESVRRYRRLLALLEVDRGRPVVEVAGDLQVSRRSVHEWLRAYRVQGSVEGLAEGTRPGRPSRWDADLRAGLERLLGQSPESAGYAATTWTVPLLQEELRHRHGQQLAEDTVRRALHRLGYTWKRARYVLEPDPERGEKGASDTGLPGAPGAPQRGAG